VRWRRALARRAPAPPRLLALLHSALALLVAATAGRQLPAPHPGGPGGRAAKRDRDTRMQAGFLNACLRRFLRERRLLCAGRHDPVARWNHPAWWVERLQRDHPTHWQAILEPTTGPARWCCA
jgi:16S rRNA (cytosine967-C5)-methyltransferase